MGQPTMGDVNDSSHDRKDVRKTSGASRRIVVENLPAEEAPRVQGRRLETPADLGRDSRILAAPPQSPASGSPARGRIGLSQERHSGTRARKTRAEEPI